MTSQQQIAEFLDQRITWPRASGPFDAEMPWDTVLVAIPSYRRPARPSTSLPKSCSPSPSSCPCSSARGSEPPTASSSPGPSRWSPRPSTAKTSSYSWPPSSAPPSSSSRGASRSPAGMRSARSASSRSLPPSYLRSSPVAPRSSQQHHGPRPTALHAGNPSQLDPSTSVKLAASRRRTPLRPTPRRLSPATARRGHRRRHGGRRP